MDGYGMRGDGLDCGLRSVWTRLPLVVIIKGLPLAWLAYKSRFGTHGQRTASRIGKDSNLPSVLRSGPVHRMSCLEMVSSTESST